MLAYVCNLISPKKLLGLIAVECPVFRVSFFDDIATKSDRKTGETHPAIVGTFWLSYSYNIPVLPVV